MQVKSVLRTNRGQSPILLPSQAIPDFRPTPVGIYYLSTCDLNGNEAVKAILPRKESNFYAYELNNNSVIEALFSENAFSNEV